MSDTRVYHHAGLGGTFDRFHKGHESLLEKAINSADRISIGITTNQYSSSKYLGNIIETYELRKKSVEKFFIRKSAISRVTIFPLSDLYGPTLVDETIDCLIVTNHTLNGAKTINHKRISLGLKDLPIITADLVKDEVGEYISSSSIRQGLISRTGKYFPTVLNQDIVLTDSQKSLLKKPFGQIFSTEKLFTYMHNHPGVRTSVVGDASLTIFLKNNISFQCGIFDNHIQRNQPSEVLSLLDKEFVIDKVKNMPGTISKSAVATIKNNPTKKVQLIEVEGEEDLLVIPLILLQPLCSYIIYGQPGIGSVLVTVSEDLKEKILKLLCH